MNADKILGICFILLIFNSCDYQRRVARALQMLPVYEKHDSTVIKTYEKRDSFFRLSIKDSIRFGYVTLYKDSFTYRINTALPPCTTTRYQQTIVRMPEKLTVKETATKPSMVKDIFYALCAFIVLVFSTLFVKTFKK
jgi:hypothetical protein